MARASGLAAVVLLLAASSTAEARTDNAYAHNYEQVWSTAVRMIRVDYGFPIRDQDRDIGYLLFDYTDRGRTFPGSVEMVPVRQDGRDQIRVTMTIPAMPTYIERMLLDRLGRKLISDFGEPPPPPPRQRPPREAPPPDDDEPGDDGDGDGGDGDRERGDDDEENGSVRPRRERRS
jgi:hypothetical protein